MAEKLTKLGTSINSVILTFSSVSDSDVHPVLLNFLKDLIQTKMTDITDETKSYNLISMHISSTSEPYKAHKPGGPHRSGKAVDISKINGKSITNFYDSDAEVSGIADALQYKAIDDDRVWENFGPLICLKTYSSKPLQVLPNSDKRKALISLHKTHLHFSVLV
jgi:hypothetical protein